MKYFECNLVFTIQKTDFSQSINQIQMLSPWYLASEYWTVIGMVFLKYMLLLVFILQKPGLRPNYPIIWIITKPGDQHRRSQSTEEALSKAN